MRPIEIQRQINAKGKGDVFGNIAFSLMSNFSLSFEDVKKIPIPMALYLLKKLKEENAKMEKQTKARKK